MKLGINRTILIASLLVAVAVILNNWLSGQREERARERGEAQQHVPDYFLRGFVATTMNQQGRPDHQLAGEMMVHYGDDGTMELTQPRLTLYANGDAAWHVDAARGLLSEDGAQLELSGGVRISRADQGALLELTTNNMLIRPKERYAETEAPLTLTHPQGQMEAIGLRAYMREERLLLLSQVKGRYVPTQP